MKNMKTKKVSVIGLGYTGLPLAVLLTKDNVEVVGFDVDKEKVALINSGVLPFAELGLESKFNEAIKKGFKASTDLQPSDFHIISVPTPCHHQRCDFTYLDLAVESIKKVLREGDTVIVESTIAPGTCTKRVKPILDKLGFKYYLAHCPERAIPGNTLNELINNDRIIGGVCETSTENAVELYSTFVKGGIHKTDTVTAECVKIVENTYRDVNIAFANELSMTLAEFGVSAFEVIRLANKHPRVNILQPGSGVGGHCIAVDPWFLVESTKSGALIRLARQINDEKPVWIAAKALKFAYANKFTKVGLLGTAYKKDVDDTRESPTLTVESELRNFGLKVFLHDPHVEEVTEQYIQDFKKLQETVDFFVLLTDHTGFAEYIFDKPVLDSRNLIPTGIDVHLV
jgi:UDP-N-acetylglucosamine 2-epimerase (non-hydrolysing)